MKMVLSNISVHREIETEIETESDLTGFAAS